MTTHQPEEVSGQALRPDPERVRQLQSLGIELMEKHERIGSMDYAAEAAEIFQQALDLTQESDPERLTQLHLLGSAYYALYQFDFLASKALYLHKAIRFWEEELSLMSVDHPDWPALLEGLSEAYYERYYEEGSTSDIDMTIQHSRQVIDVLLPDHGSEMRARKLLELSNYHNERYQRTRVAQDLDFAICLCQESLDIIPDESVHWRARILEELANRHGIRYERTEGRDDLDATVQRFHEALDLTPNDSENRKVLLIHTSASHYKRYLIMGEMADYNIGLQYFQDTVFLECQSNSALYGSRVEELITSFSCKYVMAVSIAHTDAIIQKLQVAHEITPSDDTERRAIRAEDLAVAYIHRYIITGSVSDLDSAMQKFQLSVDLTSDDRNRGPRLQNVAICFGCKYQRTRAMENLNMMIQRYREALQTMKDSSLEKDSLIKHLTIALRMKNRDTGATSDFQLPQVSDYDHDLKMMISPDIQHHNTEKHRDRCQTSEMMSEVVTRIQCLEDGLSLVPGSHPERPHRLQVLGAGYSEKARQTGCVADFDKAIELAQQSLSLTPVEHVVEHLSRLHDLGLAYRNRYERTGAREDLDNAVRRLQTVVNRTKVEDPAKVDRLQSLGVAYGHRHQISGALADIEKAIHQFETAVGLSVDKSRDLANLLHNLGTAYQNKFRRSRQVSDIDAAIQKHQQALDITSGTSDTRADHIHCLGIAYQKRCKITNSTADYDRAIDLCQEALDLTPEDDANRPKQLHSLGVGYRLRYLKARAATDLEMATQRCQEATARTPDDLPENYFYLRSLRILHADKYRQTGEKIEIEKASQYLISAFNHPLSTTENRLQSGRELFQVFATAKLWSIAYQTAHATVSLIPKLSGRFLAKTDKQDLVTRIAGFTSDAAAAALMAGRDAYDAVELLEIGHGIIIGSLNEMRIDLSDLEKVHPELAMHFVSLRGHLDAPDSYMQSQINRRYDAAKSLERAINDIRGLDGLDRFLLQPSRDEFMAAAKSGPIVMINTSRYGCHAIIIEEKGLKPLKLPLLHYDNIQTRRSMLRAGAVDKETLEWLWNTLAKPVLDVLGFTDTPAGDSWPRMWWIATGPLRSFPIHAAGYHSTPPSNNAVLDRVISSYSSSIKALIHGRRSRAKATSTQRPANAVLLGMDELYHAPREVEELVRVLGSMDIKADRTRPRVRDTLAALKDCEIFHFAGHGRIDPSDPSNSSLQLTDGPLTVASLFESNLQSRAPYLAYLSACGTGQMKHDALADEGLHLIGACQLAGFQNAVGALWEVNDGLCVDVAVKTYECLQKHGMSERSVSEGLHQAIRDLRSRWVLGYDLTGVRMAQEDSQDGTSLSQGTDQGLAVRQERTNCARNFVAVEDVPPHWAPFVHFGI